MKPLGITLFLGWGAAVFFAGCATTPKSTADTSDQRTVTLESRPPAPASTATPEPLAPTIADEATRAGPSEPRRSQRPTQGQVLGPTSPRAGEATLKIESEPSGATVVMNGRPFGKTPCRVAIAVNTRGFLREPVSIKVRFIATDGEHDSRTVEETLTPLDKLPAELRFSFTGAQRVARDVPR